MISGCRFDEGALSAIHVAPDVAGGPAANSVNIEDSLISGNNTHSADGIVLIGVQQVSITDTVISWSSLGLVAVDLRGCGDVDLDDLRLLATSMQTVKADAATRNLLVKDCQIGNLQSVAMSTLVESDGLPAIPVLTIAQRERSTPTGDGLDDLELRHLQSAGPHP